MNEKLTTVFQDNPTVGVIHESPLSTLSTLSILSTLSTYVTEGHRA
ncbi:MAG: hypothetical protein GY757_28995 [bacterium]|nr:hypothetical protein [bacterium]